MKGLMIFLFASFAMPGQCCSLSGAYHSPERYSQAGADACRTYFAFPLFQNVLFAAPNTLL